MKYNLKSKLSLSIALVVLLTVAFISLLANFIYFINVNLERKKKK